MNIRYFKEYSNCLNRDMEFKVYGDSGIPFLMFPTQNGRFYECEDFKLIETVSDLIDEGKIQIICMDSIDAESWSDLNGDEGHRIWMHEQWYYYICNELLPRIHDLRQDDAKFITSGCSMGATHAMNFFLRRPDLFSGVIAMSGAYDAKMFFPDFKDSKIYDNSPIAYMANMPKDHHYLELYRNSIIIFSCGQGAWEDIMLKDSDLLSKQLNDLGIPHFYDKWGYDVNHDWPWWRKQFPYFVRMIIND